jgi:hypothetical protein
MYAVALLMAVGVQGQFPSKHEIWARHKKCGFVFNVDGLGPPGSGVFLTKDRRTLLVERRPGEQAKRQCLVTWAESRGLKIRYVPISH